MAHVAVRYPRNLGIDIPKKGQIYELFVTGKDHVGVLSELSSTISKHGINITSTTTFSARQPGEFIFVAILDFEGNNTGVSALTSEIRRLQFVIHADMVKPVDSLFEQYLFPPTIMDNRRVLIVRAVPWLRVERRLRDAMGSGGNTIMFEVGRDYGLAVVEDYRKDVPGVEGEILMKNVIEGARATGWGLYELPKIKNDHVTITIVEPPMSETPDISENWFFYGTTTGLIEGVYGIKTSVAKSSYDHASKTLSLELHRSTR